MLKAYIWFENLFLKSDRENLIGKIISSMKDVNEFLG